MPTINIALAQLNFTVGAMDDNHAVMLEAIQTAKALAADILVFPELALSGYPPEDLLLRRDFLALNAVYRDKLVSQVAGIEVIITYPERIGDKTYNCAAWIRDQKIIATYHKQALPNTGLLDEKRYFSPGHEATIVTYRGVAFGLLICEDIWQEAPIRQAKAAGADCILCPNASPFRFDKQQHRIDILKTRAKSTALPIFYVNHVGSQDEFLFDGQSTAISADGEIMAQAPAFQETLFMATLDTQKKNIAQQALTPIHPLDLIYQGLVTATRDYLEKNHFPGAIIGLSGGIDSALTLAIAVDAIGAKRVHAVLMPSQYSADISLADARTQAETLGVSYDIIPIKPVFDAFLTALHPVFSGLPTDTTEENLQARIRGTLLMALSNKTGKLVLTTGNKSEMAVGYATLYGDMAGGFAVLKDVYKTTVYALAKHLNTHREMIPERVITRPPSAELAPNQQDQDSLPPYEILDGIIKGFVEDDLSIDEIAAQGYDRALVAHIVRLIQINEYKRRQAPPGTRITKRAFGRNRRYPITSGFSTPF